MPSVCPKFFVKPSVYLAYFPQSGVALACRGTDLQDLCVFTLFVGSFFRSSCFYSFPLHVGDET